MHRYATVLGVVMLMGCSAATTLRYTLADGSVLDLHSAKSQTEEKANYKLTFGADGKLSLIDLGTKNTVPVNMTADTIQSMIGLIPSGAK